MDLSIPGSTTNSLLTPVFGDNVQDLLGTGAINVNPTGIIVVNSLDDALNDPESGVTTLRDAINQANGDRGEDLIVFDHSLFSNAQTITLSQGELDLTHNLDIIAPQDSLTGADLLTVSGNNATRVFGVEAGTTVNIDGLIIADGLVTGGDSGGGIKNSGNLTLDSSIVNNNSTNNGGSGGGIYNSGIYAILSVSNSTLMDNKTFLSGGGIYNFGGTVEVSNSNFSNNTSMDGGGISNNGTLTINNSTISGNLASGISGFGGGGIYSDGRKLTVSNSTISGNMAMTSGGGISKRSGTVEVSNSTISGNTAQGLLSLGVKGEVTGGGGIYNGYNGGTMMVSNSTISGNTEGSSSRNFSGNGGGISNGGALTVSNSIISGNSTKGDGGGIYNASSNFAVSSSTLSGNSAQNGGGIYNGVTSRVMDTTISGNSATNYGGGIYNDYAATVTLLFSIVTQNIAANGGGVYQSDTSVTYFPQLSSVPHGSNSARNTIIAANFLSTDGVNPDVSGTFTSNGYNLIGDGTGSTGFGTTGDIVGTSDNPIDPRLAPLDFYGGSTQTIALLPDSPAIGAGDPTVLDTDPTTDQRSFPRRASDGRTDIGAFELS